jgi:hypothetical protein
MVMAAQALFAWQLHPIDRDALARPGEAAIEKPIAKPLETSSVPWPD